MNQVRWLYFIDFGVSVTAVVATPPMLFAPTVFLPAVAVGGALGALAVIGVFVFGEADRLQAGWEAVGETNRSAWVLITAVQFGLYWSVSMALLMPLLTEESVVTSDWVGVGASIPLVVATAGHAFFTWLGDRYGDRLQPNQAPDPP